mmetsp:Transcript_5030/g.12544  ORF Transcript_5030/g.12544 Transcript_5030/m.12544 type:complete len:213 (-) Transcript_5030:801-1439(-)
MQNSRFQNYMSRLSLWCKYKFKLYWMNATAVTCMHSRVYSGPSCLCVRVRVRVRVYVYVGQCVSVCQKAHYAGEWEGTHSEKSSAVKYQGHAHVDAFTAAHRASCTSPSGPHASTATESHAGCAPPISRNRPSTSGRPAALTLAPPNSTASSCTPCSLPLPSLPPLPPLPTGALVPVTCTMGVMVSWVCCPVSARRSGNHARCAACRTAHRR